MPVGNKGAVPSADVAKVCGRCAKACKQTGYTTVLQCHMFVRAEDKKGVKNGS